MQFDQQLMDIKSREVFIVLTIMCLMLIVLFTNKVILHAPWIILYKKSK